MVHASKSFQNYAISMITNTQNLKLKKRFFNLQQRKFLFSIYNICHLIEVNLFSLTGILKHMMQCVMTVYNDFT